MTTQLDARATDLQVRPLSGHTGAEIGNLDLSKPLGPAEVGALSAALHRWKVLVFRGQELDHASHIAFARQFGALTYAHPYDNEPPDGYPEIFTVSPERFAAQYGITGDAARKVRKRYSANNFWHTDVTAAVNPPSGSILRAEVVPAYGGDTTFTNLAAAHAGLSEALQELIAGLFAEHRYGASYRRRGIPSSSSVLRTNPLVARHPVVRVHPVTGERILYVNDGFTSHIVGLRRGESDALLGLLLNHATRAEYTVRVAWDPGTVLFWDNRATSHLGPQDIDHLDAERVLHRVTLIGDIPVGPDGRTSELVEGIPFEALPIAGTPAINLATLVGPDHAPAS